MGEKEVEEAKQKLSALSDEDMALEMQKISSQQESRKKALQDDISRQREIAQQRLQEKLRRRDDKQYEEDMVANMLAIAEQRSSMQREKTIIAGSTKRLSGGKT